METGYKGKVWPAEWRTFNDPLSGAAVKQLTDYKTHSHHLYFTENGWYDGNNRILLVSDRGNQTNLFSMDMSSGEMMQLTDWNLPMGDMNACLNAEGTKAYVKKGNQAVEIDLESANERVLYECPEGFHIGQFSCTADSKSVVSSITENLNHRIRIDLGNGYVGHQEVMEAGPLCTIIVIPLDGSPVKEIVQERNWIGHINTSPTVPYLITFCHEGPWHLVDHRIWGCDLRDGRVWKIRERIESLEKVGHEYWLEDGETVGYHGFRADGTGFFGKIKSDNTGKEEVEFLFRNWHAHSHDFSQVVVDGRSPLTLMIYWKRVNGSFGAPKILCEHRCSFHVQKVHAHPRFSPDGKRLLFTSDRNGYANLYLLDIPEDADKLPDFHPQ
jgi:oligogalacturonide lyase